MGRLGFNLLGQKEPIKNVETVESGQSDNGNQNERNETLEISELLLVIENKNATINKLRLAVLCLSIVIGCSILYMTLFGYTAWIHAKCSNEKSATFSAESEKADNLFKPEALGQYRDSTAAVANEEAKDCSEQEVAFIDMLKDTEHRLELEKSQREQDVADAIAKYEEMQNKLTTLQSKHDESNAQWTETRSNLQNEIENLKNERDSLLSKIESKKPESESQQREISTTTQKTKLPFGLSQFLKLNEALKDVETVGDAVVNAIFKDLL